MMFPCTEFVVILLNIYFFFNSADDDDQSGTSTVGFGQDKKIKTCYISETLLLCFY